MPYAMQTKKQTTETSIEWGTMDYYIDRLHSPTPPICIDISDPKLTDEDAVRFADALAATQNSGRINQGGGSRLKKLRIRGTQITSRGFLALAEAIGGVADSGSALEELDFGNTVGIADDVDDFAFGMFLLLSDAKNLKHLDLEGSSIGNRAGMALAEAVAHGEVLETLNLRNNDLDDQSTIVLASKLDYCKRLKRVDLGLNRVGPRGATALADFVATNPQLQHLILTQRQHCHAH